MGIGINSVFITFAEVYGEVKSIIRLFDLEQMQQLLKHLKGEDKMKYVAKFEKVSYEQFKKDMINTFSETLKFSENEIKTIYDNIQLPTRATKGSAGYDFKSPFTFSLREKETIKIPTGIRVRIDEDWVLKLYPRSSLGFKYRLQLDNTTGIVDSDYYYSSNEGHIFAKITNETNEKKVIEINQGDGFMQGIFIEYGITVDDEADGTRDGGFGSTNK